MTQTKLWAWHIMPGLCFAIVPALASSNTRILFFSYIVSLPEFGSPALSWSLLHFACRF